jgi:hypothetical protein
MARHAPLPNVIINTSGDSFSFFVRERRPRQCLPEIVENEHFDLRLRGRIFSPVARSCSSSAS